MYVDASFSAPVMLMHSLTTGTISFCMPLFWSSSHMTDYMSPALVTSHREDLVQVVLAGTQVA